MIVSDHGFHSWRKAVNLNTWLVQNGYMVLKGQQPGDKKLDDLFGGGTFWENVDWRRTRAYAMGLGQIYFNLRGREVAGHRQSRRRSHGARRRAEREAADDDRPGRRRADRPRRLQARRHLQRPVPPQRLGAAGRHARGLSRLVADDARRLAAGHRLHERSRSGARDHGGYDFAITSGMLVSGRPINTKEPRIIDLAPTVLKYFGIDDPDGHRWQTAVLRMLHAVSPKGAELPTIGFHRLLDWICR